MANTERYTVSQVREALEKAGGIRLGAAMQLKCAPNTIKSMIDKYPELQEAERQIKEDLLDIAETELLKAIRKGQAWAVCFYLKTQGKARGYTERKEMTGPGGGPLQNAAVTIFELPDNGRG